MRGNLIDGVIASPLAMTSDDVSDLARRRPMVLLGERFNRAAADHVRWTAWPPHMTPSRHLIELGRSRIAFIGAETDIGTAALRLAGYRKRWLGRGNGSGPGSWCGPVRSGALRGLPRSGTWRPDSPMPDAIFCVNDLLPWARSGRWSLAASGCPTMWPVVGFDDIEDGRFSLPTLTTVRPDKAGIADRAVDLLQQRILGSTDQPARDVVAAHTVAIRAEHRRRGGRPVHRRSGRRSARSGHSALSAGRISCSAARRKLSWSSGPTWTRARSVYRRRRTLSPR